MSAKPPSGEGPDYPADDFQSQYQQAPDLPGSIGGRTPGVAGSGMPLPEPPTRSLPWGAIIKYGGIAAIALVVWLASRGTTSARHIDVGDCFAMPDDGSFSSVDDQDCAEPHEAQAFAELEMSGNDIDAATQHCLELLIANSAAGDLPDLPDDFTIAIISDEDGDNAKCIAGSDSGNLVGSLVPGS